MSNTIAGGFANRVGDGSVSSTVGGGSMNRVLENSPYATIPGGRSNEVARYAFAVGYNAKATNQGAFVWSDGLGSVTTSTNDNSVTMRARGGYRLLTGGANTGAYLADGSGTWTSMSDRNAKENFEPVNPEAVLDKVVAMPANSWNYKTQPAGVRHLGPTAQDFRAAFQVGDSDLGISSVDADGVALAAIQGLNQKLEEQAALLRAKEMELEAMSARLAALEQLLQSKP